MLIDDTTIKKVLQQVADTALIQLVYVSNATFKSRLDSSLSDDIEKDATVYNKQHNITGTLCYGNGQFLQCIEGSKVDILALLQKIIADKRHDNFKISLLKPIDKRMFEDWRMRSLFLERWSWSADTKSQAVVLLPYLPFTPQDWTQMRHEQFLQTMQSFVISKDIYAVGFTYNAFANMCRHLAAPHLAFLLIQGILLLLIIIALLAFLL